MIVWLNGPFGVGKTTTARLMSERDTRWRIFDPEHVGSLLRANLAGRTFDDFQDLPAWRKLVPAVAAEVIAETNDDLVAVQSVFEQRYWHELRAGFAERDIAVVHVLLDADHDTLRNRIAADQDEPTAAEWRLGHISAYVHARRWLLADVDVVVDTATAAPHAVVETVLAALA